MLVIQVAEYLLTKREREGEEEGDSSSDERNHKRKSTPNVNSEHVTHDDGGKLNEHAQCEAGVHVGTHVG